MGGFWIGALSSENGRSGFGAGEGRTRPKFNKSRNLTVVPTPQIAALAGRIPEVETSSERVASNQR